jgi:hypothetical protein
MSLISWPYWVLALVSAAGTSLGIGWIAGTRHVQTRWDSTVASQQLVLAEVKTQQAEAAIQVVTKYVDRIQVVREKGDAILKEVPIYVPVQADAACTVHRGFVSLHDAAAAGELPEPARDADASAEGFALSALASAVATNYQICHENAEQLKALQDWIRQTR